MVVIADLAVSADDFRLGRKLSAQLQSEARLARLVPLDETIALYLWVCDDEVDTLVESLRDDTDIVSVVEADRIGGEALVRIEEASDFDGLLAAIVRSQSAVLHAVGATDQWTFQLRFTGQRQLAAFYQRCARRDIDLSLQRVYNPGLPGNPNFEFHLTTLQRETLLAALDAGYFSVPRRTNLVELAAEMDVSDTAISQRLRRGMSTLVEATISGCRSGDVSESDK